VLRDQAFQLVLSERGIAIVPVAAGDTSMAPHLAGGDLVAAVAPRERPQAGDLLVYRQQDYLVVHRYLGPAHTRDGRPCLRTRGDGRNTLDPPISAAAVIGRVVAVRRAGEWRSLEGRAASVYARLVAWHDLSWAAAGMAGRKVGLGGLVAGVDRWLLKLGVPTVFRLVHRRIAPPGAAGSDPSV
jgi:hypothetical protein